jgi:hypothetical protein
VSLLVAYVATVLVGQVFAVSIGLIVDHLYSSYAGLLVFIPLYFFVFYLAWRFAVRITEPRT